jgi:hypothetical protein
MKPYYYVYRYGKKMPIVRHQTLLSAVNEAERLAAQHLGEPFEVLQVVAISQVHKPVSTFYMDGVSQPESAEDPLW